MFRMESQPIAAGEHLFVTRKFTILVSCARGLGEDLAKWPLGTKRPPSAEHQGAEGPHLTRRKHGEG